MKVSNQLTMNLYLHWCSQGDAGPTGRDGSSGDPVRETFLFSNWGISSSAALKLCWCVSIWPELCFFNRVQEDRRGLKERRYSQNCYLLFKCINPVYSLIWCIQQYSSNSWVEAIIDYKNLKKKKLILWFIKKKKMVWIYCIWSYI